MGEEHTGPEHTTERGYERAADPADTADRPLEPRSSNESLHDADVPHPDDSDPHHRLNTHVGEIDETTDSDPISHRDSRGRWRPGVRHPWRRRRRRGPMTASPIAKRLLDATAAEHPVISVVFDLNPAEFATAPGRASQANSLLDAAHNLESADQTLSHDARQAVRSDLERLDDLPRVRRSCRSRARERWRSIASHGSGLFETVALSQPSASSIYLDRQPHIEPVVIEPNAQRWCAVLVSARDVTIDLGAGATVDQA